MPLASPGRKVPVPMRTSPPRCALSCSRTLFPPRTSKRRRHPQLERGHLPAGRTAGHNATTLGTGQSPGEDAAPLPLLLHRARGSHSTHRHPAKPSGLRAPGAWHSAGDKEMPPGGATKGRWVPGRGGESWVPAGVLGESQRGGEGSLVLPKTRHPGPRGQRGSATPGCPLSQGSPCLLE